MAWYDSAVFYHMYPLGMVGAEKQNDGGEIRHRFSERTEHHILNSTPSSRT